MRFLIQIYSDKPIKVTWPGYEKIVEVPENNWPHALYVGCPHSELKIEEVETNE